MVTSTFVLVDDIDVAFDWTLKVDDCHAAIIGDSLIHLRDAN
jgi:hypothetical protein